MTVDRRSKVTGVSVFLFCFALFLTAFSARHPRSLSAGSAIANEVQRPVQYVAVTVLDWVSSLWRNYFALVNLRQEYEQQKTQLRNLERDKIALLELQQENERLKRLLSVTEKSPLAVKKARVIAYDPSNWVHAVTIDVGMADGIRENMPVMTEVGVVGQVIAAGVNVSKVLLITDHSSGLDALLQSSRARGIIEGGGSENLRWRFVVQEEEVKPGDRLVTSGMDGVYPPGLSIGVVEFVDRGENGMFQRIEVRPAVDMSRLEDLLVVLTEPLERLKGPNEKK